MWELKELVFINGFNHIQDGLFRGKICHAYPTMMKLGTVILYLKKIQKIYESRDNLLEFC